MALNFQPYQDREGAEARRRWMGTLDDIFSTYQAAKLNAQQQTRLGQQDAIAAQDRQRQMAVQDLLLRKEYNGVNPLNMTPDQRNRGLAGPTMTPAVPASGSFDMGGNQATPAQAEQTTYDSDPDVAKLQAVANQWKQSRVQGAEKNALENRKTTAEIGKLNAEAGKLGREGQAITLPDKARIEGQLYDDYRNAQTVKNFTQVRDAYRNIATLAKGKSGINDVGIVYSLVKMLDPNSAVREGEIALSNQATPLAQKVATAWNNAAKGRVSADEKNREILAAARSIYNESKKGVDMERGVLSKRGAQYGIDANIVFPDFGIPQDEMLKLDSIPGTQFQSGKYKVTVEK